VHPVVGGVVGVGREGTGAAVGVDAVPAVHPVGDRVQLVVARGEVAEVAGGGRVVPVRREVRHDVGRVRVHVDRTGEDQFLPTGRGLVGERAGGQPRSGGRPQRTGVRAGVARSLVEPDAADLALGVVPDLGADLDRAVVVGRGDGRGGEVVPDRARTGR